MAHSAKVRAGLEALGQLQRFMSAHQRNYLHACMINSEERDYFAELIVNLNRQIKAMPLTYQSKDHVAHLHYFIRNIDAYISEKDSEYEQHQAYGAQDIGYGAEIGYVSIPELLKVGAELDLYWTPRPLKEIV